MPLYTKFAHALHISHDDDCLNINVITPKLHFGDVLSDDTYQMLGYEVFDIAKVCYENVLLNLSSDDDLLNDRHHITLKLIDELRHYFPIADIHAKTHGTLLPLELIQYHLAIHDTPEHGDVWVTIAPSCHSDMNTAPSCHLDVDAVPSQGFALGEHEFYHHILSPFFGAVDCHDELSHRDTSIQDEHHAMTQAPNDVKYYAKSDIMTIMDDIKHASEMLKFDHANPKLDALKQHLIDVHFHHDFVELFYQETWRAFNRQEWLQFIEHHVYVLTYFYDRFVKKMHAILTTNPDDVWVVFYKVTKMDDVSMSQQSGHHDNG